QPRQSRCGDGAGPRAAQGQADEDRRGDVQLLRVRRHQRLGGVQEGHVTRRGRRPVRKDTGILRALLRRWTLLPLPAGVVSGGAYGVYRMPGPAAQPADIILPKGAGVRQIAGALKGAGLIWSKTLFEISARANGKAGRLKAGEYEFRAHVPMAAVLGDIAE